jgi:hypothetical protein
MLILSLNGIQPVDDFGDFTGFGEAAGLCFGVHLLAAGNHVEGAGFAGSNFGIEIERVMQLCCHTDSVGFVVSN